MCYGDDPLQLQLNITLASGLFDHLFFCRLMLELASGKTTVMGEAGDGWFSVFASSPTLFANLSIVCTWFHILTNPSFFLEFPVGCFLSFTHHTALDSGNRDYTQQKAPISPYYRFSNLWVCLRIKIEPLQIS